MKNKILTASILLILLASCGPVISRGELASQNVIDDLNKRIAGLRQMRDEGKINDEIYYATAWAAYRIVGEQYGAPELIHLGVFGQFQAQRLIKGEITRPEYEWLVIEKRNEFARQVEASQQANVSNSLGSVLTVLQILSLLGPQSPLAGGPHSAPTYHAAPTSTNTMPVSR